MKTSKHFYISLSAAALFACGCSKACNDSASCVKSEGDAAVPVAATEVLADAGQEALPENLFASFSNDTVLASVGEKALTYGEFKEKLAKVMSAGAVSSNEQAMAMEDPRVIRDFVERFVITAILDAEAGKQGLEATEDEVVSQVSNIVAMSRGSVTNLGDIARSFGAEESEVRQEIAASIAINKLLKELTDKIDISEDEVAKFYKENPNYFRQPETIRASHILVKVEDTEDAEAMAKAKVKAENILKEILTGTNTAQFATFAEKYSDCPSAASGGDLGFFDKSRMVPKFAEAAFALDIGKISGVVETEFGFHIIKLTDRKESSTVALEQVAPNIRSFLLNEKKGRAVGDYVEALRIKSSYTVADGLKDRVFQKEQYASEPVEADACDDACAE